MVDMANRSRRIPFVLVPLALKLLSISFHYPFEGYIIFSEGSLLFRLSRL